jgi:hypothetical protein
MNDDAARMASLRRALDRLTARINDRIDDAAAHAANALTARTIAAAEGRATWRSLRTQRSSEAAAKRLEETLTWLAGPSDTAFDGAIQRARSGFCREAVDYWSTILPATILSATSPAATLDRQCRGLILWGRSCRQTLATVFTTVASSLQSTLNAVATPTLSPSQREQSIDRWATNTKQQIGAAVLTLLSDSQVAIETMVGQQMIRPELRSTE